ncbi:hypothetical protein D9M73_201470 [compost metagenome]
MAQLSVVKATGHFLAVAGDEGHGRALVQQAHGRLDLLRAYAQFLGDTAVDAVHVNHLTFVNTGVACGLFARRRWMKAAHYTHRKRLAVMAPGQPELAPGEKSANNAHATCSNGYAIMRGDIRGVIHDRHAKHR